MGIENIGAEERLHIRMLESLLKESKNGAVFFKGKHGEVRHEIRGAHLNTKKDYYFVGHLVLNGVVQEKEEKFEALQIRYVPDKK